MFPKDKERGLRIPIIRRFGLKGFGQWRGLNKQNDRGALSPVNFWEVVNLRNSGGSWDVRGGLSAPVNTNVFTGCVTGIIDIPGEDPLPILVACATTTVLPAEADFLTVYNAYTATSADILTGTAITSVTPSSQCMTLYNGEIYVADTGATEGISKLILSTSPGETLADTRTYTRVVDVPYAITCLHSAFGKIWIATANGYAYSWDGTTLTEVLTSIPAGPCYIWSYNESIYLTAQDLFGRMNSDASWTFFALPAHTGGVFYPRCIASCPTVDKLYFGGYTYYSVALPVDGGSYSNNYFCTLYSFDGTSVQEVFGVSTSVDNLLSCATVDTAYTAGIMNDSGVSAIVEYNGTACFMYMLLKNGGEQRIGLIGSLADLQAVQIGDNNLGLSPAVTCLFVDTIGQLYAGINADIGNNTANNQNRIIRMDNATLSGYWKTSALTSGWTAIGGTAWGDFTSNNQPPYQIFSTL